MIAGLSVLGDIDRRGHAIHKPVARNLLHYRQLLFVKISQVFRVQVVREFYQRFDTMQHLRMPSGQPGLVARKIADDAGPNALLL